MKYCIKFFLLLFFSQITIAQTTCVLQNNNPTSTELEKVEYQDTGNGEWGYLTGHNHLEDFGWGEKYYIDCPGEINSLKVHFYGTSNVPNKRIYFAVSTIGTNGLMDTDILWKNVPYSQINIDGSPTIINFANTVTVSDSFIVHFSLQDYAHDPFTLGTDTMVVLHSLDGTRPTSDLTTTFRNFVIPHGRGNPIAELSIHTGLMTHLALYPIIEFDASCTSVTADACGVCNGTGLPPTACACDSQFDIAWYPDTNGDGLGDPSAPPVNGCTPPPGYVDNSSDSIRVYPKVLLEGPYDSSTGLMSTTLNTLGILPTTQPFGSMLIGYNGTESVTSFPPNVVDWVLVELRDPNNPYFVIARSAALLTDNGDIIDTDGNLGAVINSTYPIPNNFYISIRHKGHLPVMTTGTSSFNGVYDFTTLNANGIDQMHDFGGGVFAMHAGHYDDLGINTVEDFDAFVSKASSIYQYQRWDVNFDGIVNVLDYNFYKKNALKLSINFLWY